MYDPSMSSIIRAGVLKDEVEQLAVESYASLEHFYRDLHAHPELSRMEEKTSAKVAAQLRASDFEVTERIGGHGVVAVMKNGPGPTLLIRADMDALPIKEETGLPYASCVRAVDGAGREVPVMHACGHDLHSTVLVGAARSLARLRHRWSGTLVLIGQPAEEDVSGASRMLADGLFHKFPKPDYALALHDSPILPAGTFGLTEGFVMANVDDLSIVVRGVGGHGAFPHLAKDPLILSARIIMALQTIISREIDPVSPAVITVGSIHGGTASNIIPDSVELKVTVRSYGDQVRVQLIEAIRRVCRGEAIAAGLPENLMPLVAAGDGCAPATYNDPALTQRVREVLTKRFGPEQVRTVAPSMVSEDFGQFGRTPENVPICFFWLGAADRAKLDESQRSGIPLPGLHSSHFAPALDPTIRAGVAAMAGLAIELLPCAS
jgi:amidohydrolase